MMQNNKEKRVKSSKQISELPPHNSSEIYEKNQRNEVKYRKKQSNYGFISNITCPARKAFYQDAQTMPWKTSRPREMSGTTLSQPRHVAKPIREIETTPIRTIVQRRSKFIPTMSTPQFFKTDPRDSSRPTRVNTATTKGANTEKSLNQSSSWFKPYPNTAGPKRKSMFHRNSKMQQPALSVPYFNEVEPKKNAYKLVKPNEKKLKTISNVHSSSQTRNLYIYGSEDLAFRPRRKELAHNDIFVAAPHLKYGMFGKRKSRTQNNQSERLSPKSTANELTRAKRRSGFHTRDPQRYAYSVKKLHTRNLTLSEIMHIDIKPVHRTKSPTRRHPAPFYNNMSYRGIISPEGTNYYGNVSPPAECVTPRKMTQSLRNIIPFRNRSLPFRNTSFFRNIEPNCNASSFCGILPMIKSTVNRQI